MTIDDHTDSEYMLSVLCCAAVAFTPSPLPSAAAGVTAGRTASAPTMSLDLRRSALLSSAAAAATTAMPLAAHASLKQEIGEALGPVAEYGDIIGVAAVGLLAAANFGVFSGGSDTPPEEPPASETSEDPKPPAA